MSSQGAGGISPAAHARSKLAKVFGDHCDGVALWEWLPWLPQLLNCLKPHTVDGDDPASSGGSSQVQHLLIRIAKVYPQALYYPLRTYLADNEAKLADMDAAAEHAARHHKVVERERRSRAAPEVCTPASGVRTMSVKTYAGMSTTEPSMYGRTSAHATPASAPSADSSVKSFGCCARYA